MFTSEAVVIPSLYLNPGVFARADGEARVAVTTADVGDAVVLVGEADFVPGTLTLERICYVAVTDPTRDGALYLCDAEAGAPEDGDRLRLYGSPAHHRRRERRGEHPRPHGPAHLPLRRRERRHGRLRIAFATTV